jgi:hypothetical protein
VNLTARRIVWFLAWVEALRFYASLQSAINLCFIFQGLSVKRARLSTLLILLITGCAGTRVLEEPVALETTQPLGVVEDGRVRMTLDWVVVHNGPGTWARGAYWDEYLVRIKNMSEFPVNLQKVTLVDSLGTSIEPGLSRQTLVEASRENLRRYGGQNILVKPGEGNTTMMVAGGVALVGAGTAWAVSVTQATFTAGAAGGTAASVAGGLLVAGPALIVGGMVRKSNQRAVDRQIRRLRTQLPQKLVSGEEQLLHIFFPISPSPTSLGLEYFMDHALYDIELDTRDTLLGLHLASDK